MPTWVRAGIAYFAAVFAVGFLLGTLRVTLVVPRVGDFAAVALELPLLLAASWIICRKLVARFGVAGNASHRLRMGAFAFAILMLAEVALSVFLMHRTVLEHFASYQSARGILGLTGQVVFALIPWIQRSGTR